MARARQKNQKDNATRRQRLTAEEQQLIALLEKDYGRPMTDQEIRLSLEQARPLGEI